MFHCTEGNLWQIVIQLKSNDAINITDVPRAHVKPEYPEWDHVRLCNGRWGCSYVIYGTLEFISGMTRMPMDGLFNSPSTLPDSVVSTAAVR